MNPYARLPYYSQRVSNSRFQNRNCHLRSVPILCSQEPENLTIFLGSPPGFVMQQKKNHSGAENKKQLHVPISSHGVKFNTPRSTIATGNWFLLFPLILASWTISRLQRSSWRRAAHQLDCWKGSQVSVEFARAQVASRLWVCGNKLWEASSNKAFYKAVAVAA